MRARFLALGAWTLSASAACESVIGADFDDVAPLVKGATDAGSDSSSQCDLAHPPGPPALTNSGGDADLYVVATNILFGEDTTEKGVKPPAFGYDLDGLCANHGDPPPCQPPSGGDPTDGLRGEDNATCNMIGDQWSVLGQADPPLTTKTATAAVAAGKFAPLILLHVKDWLAGYDDEKVTVEWFVGLPANLAAGGGFTPKFDGSDVWPVLAKAEGSSEPLKFVDESAYVFGRKLVARFPVARVPLTTVYLELHDAIVTGQLELGAGNKWTLSGGMVAGRMAADELLHTMPQFTQALLGFPLCSTTSVYVQQIKPWVCASAESLLPGTTAGSACNAMSMGVGFDAVQVTVGDALTPPKTAVCPPGQDTSNDSCASTDGGSDL